MTGPRAHATQLLADGPLRAGAWIDGKEHPLADSIVRRSPIDGQEVTQVAAGGSATVDAAVDAARRAFEDGPWRRRPPEERQAALARFAGLILRDADDLAVIESLENGMPYGMCRNRNVTEAAECFRWYGDAVGKLSDESLWLNETHYASVSREPVGVVGLIVPWNFPMMIASWKAAPALAVGCSVILKPPVQAGAAMSRWGALAKEAGIPDGVFNIVTGNGGEAGAALAGHPGVDCVGFTGSTSVGKGIMRAGADNLKRVWLECGGKTAEIVLEDCADFEAVIKVAATAFYRHQGQICNAGSRLIVPASRVDEAAEITSQVAGALAIGDPLDPTINFGPVISEEAADEIVAAIKRAVAQGANLVAGGSRALPDSGGSYVQPTVLAGVTSDMEAAQREIFGPALAVMPYADEDEAIAIANGTDYGLGACLFTKDLSRAHLLARRLRAGHVQVNQPAGASLRLPFGGFKQSGFGRDKSLHAFDKYTELKATTLAL